MMKCLIVCFWDFQSLNQNQHKRLNLSVPLKLHSRKGLSLNILSGMDNVAYQQDPDEHGRYFEIVQRNFTKISQQILHLTENVDTLSF